MGDRLSGKKVAFLATTGVEQVELTEPRRPVESEGGQPELVSIGVANPDFLRQDGDAVAFTRDWDDEQAEKTASA